MHVSAWSVCAHTSHAHSYCYICLKLMCNDAMIACEVDVHPNDCYERDFIRETGITVILLNLDSFPICLRFTLGFLSGNESACTYINLGAICRIQAAENKEKIRENEDLHFSPHLRADRHRRGSITRRRSSSRALSLSESLHLSVQEFERSQTLS